MPGTVLGSGDTAMIALDVAPALSARTTQGPLQAAQAVNQRDVADIIPVLMQFAFLSTKGKEYFKSLYSEECPPAFLCTSVQKRLEK